MLVDDDFGPIELRSAQADDRLLQTGQPLVPFDASEHRRFVEACEHLLPWSEKEPLGLGTASPPLRVAVPDRFLAAPLTADERLVMNQRFALPAARLAGELQERVAKVPIEECGERFESIADRFGREQLPLTLSDLPFSEACGAWAGQKRVFWVREGVMDRLVTLARICAGIDLHLHVEDAFRPPGVQEGLYARRIRWTRDAHPDWSEDEIHIEARSKTAATPRLASHKGGAAIDVRLRRTDGSFLDIGHDYPDGGAVVALDAPFVTQSQWVNRHILLVASHLAGLTTYPAEDWHLNFGDNLAVVSHHASDVARYGPVRSFDQQTGELIEIYAPDELDRPFS